MLHAVLTIRWRDRVLYEGYVYAPVSPMYQSHLRPWEPAVLQHLGILGEPWTACQSPGQERFDNGRHGVHYRVTFSVRGMVRGEVEMVLRECEPPRVVVG